MKQQRAFTLVELSIVLVILGLLVGGVLTGQSLIRAAELRSVTTQYAGYMTAVQTFRDKYFALPGDMTNATSYWGPAASGASCITTVGTGTQTCNGDGDGMLEDSANSASSNEIFRFWQHLANAGLIEGNYDGVTHGSNSVSATTLNSPLGRISGSMWFVYYWGTITSGSAWFDGQYNNSFEFGKILVNGDPSQGILKPEELYNIDMKVDDGKPATGKLVMRAAWAACTTASNSTTLSADYLLSSTQPTCAAIFRQQF